jgi:hypothetical protein
MYVGNLLHTYYIGFVVLNSLYTRDIADIDAI